MRSAGTTTVTVFVIVEADSRLDCYLSIKKSKMQSGFKSVIVDI